MVNNDSDKLDTYIYSWNQLIYHAYISVTYHTELIYNTRPAVFK